MPRYFFLILAAVFACVRGAAQAPERRHLLRAGVASVLQPNSANLAYEYRWNPKAGVALEAIFYGHGRAPESVFEGDWVTTYAEQRVDSFIVWSHKALNDGQWRYITENRPLPEAPARYVALNSLVLKLGYVMPYTSKNGRWSLLLQPGFFAGRHRYYSIVDDIQLLGAVEDGWTWYVLTSEARALQRTRFYKQTRVMRIQDAAIYGLAYDVAVSHKVGKCLSVELRGCIGYNLNAVFEAAVPAPARRFFGNLGINIGYTF